MQAKKYVKKKKDYGVSLWAAEDRPREKLLSRSPQHLSNAELIAVILNCGTSQKTCIDLATEILKMAKNNLEALSKISPRQFMKIEGVGEAKAAKIAACLELGRRQQATLPVKLSVVNGIIDAAYYLRTHFSHFPYEIFGVLFLDNANNVLEFTVISAGGITSTIVDIRIVIRKALEANATKLILGHNHPSGNLQPSKPDKDLTEKIRTAAKTFDIAVLDHLIITNQGYFSFANEGLI